MAFIDGWAIFARYATRFVLKMASYDWFRETAAQSLAPTVVSFEIPLPHLLQEQFFVVLVLSPAHVENEGLDFTRNHSFHVVFGLVVFHATWE